MSLTITISGQPLQVLDTNQLALFYNKTAQTDTWLLDTLYPVRRSFPNVSEINIGSLQTVAPLAPFVIPAAQARVIANKASYVAQSVPAAYLKPARVVTPDTVYDQAIIASLRAAGAVGNASLSMAEKMRIAQASEFNHLRESIQNRKLLMAVDILLTGKTTYAGDDQPPVLVDYGRDAALAYVPTIKWDQANAVPIDDLQALTDLLIAKGGAAPSMYITSSRVLNKLMGNAQYQARYKTINDFGVLSAPIIRRDRAVLSGYLDGVPVYTYDATHLLNGTSQRFIPDTAFIAVADTSGSVNSCQLKHLDVLGQALDVYDYAVIERDPSAMKLISESAPLVAPGNVNGIAVATVL